MLDRAKVSQPTSKIAATRSISTIGDRYPLRSEDRRLGLHLNVMSQTTDDRDCETILSETCSLGARRAGVPVSRCPTMPIILPIPAAI